jgi:hypothetical protein
MSDLEVGSTGRSELRDSAHRVVEQNGTANEALFAECADCHRKQPTRARRCFRLQSAHSAGKRSVCGSVPLGRGRTVLRRFDQDVRLGSRTLEFLHFFGLKGRDILAQGGALFAEPWV